MLSGAAKYRTVAVLSQSAPDGLLTRSAAVNRGFAVAELSKERGGVDRYELVVRRMNTFVCENCFAEELMRHPTLGDTWTEEWYVAMAHLAKVLGWQMVPTPEVRESYFFEEFKVVGPKCSGNE